MIAFSCHTWSFPDLTLPEAFGLIARLGFRQVDIGSGAALNAARAATDPARLAADLRADLEAFNLHVSDLYLMLPRISLAATAEDAERRARELELFRALIPFALELGVNGITVSPGLAPPPDAPPIQPPSGSQPISPAEAGAPAASAAEFAFNRAADALRAMLETARSSGLRLSIEPHLDSIAPTPAQALRLIEAVPGLAITLDWAELACQNVPLDEIARLLPHT
ncbi:MAG: sugar phosphate isomerase/epimerase, partial [Anaerolinea sp.]|nr:sugar phosphate isomerase/epimerase [Anaerolinea sp.]